MLPTATLATCSLLLVGTTLDILHLRALGEILILHPLDDNLLSPALEASSLSTFGSHALLICLRLIFINMFVVYTVCLCFQHFLHALIAPELESRTLYEHVTCTVAGVHPARHLRLAVRG